MNWYAENFHFDLVIYVFIGECDKISIFYREGEMQLIVTVDDLARLKPETVADLFSQLGIVRAASAVVTPQTSEATAVAPTRPADDGEIDFEDVVDLTADQIADLVNGLSEKAVDGLEVFARHGPCIDIQLLKTAGITNYGRFQAAVTRRTRTVTCDQHALLFGWDNWQWDEATDSQKGHYSVTQRTYESLKSFFSDEKPI